jgi:hypothetical protein
MAVFELLGVDDPARRRELVNRLYEATAAHFREIRVVEIKKMEQRAKSKTRRIGIEEVAAEAWEAVYFSEEPPLTEWIAETGGPTVTVTIPTEGAPRLIDEQAMFDKEIVYFGSERNAPRVVCASRPQAELVARLAAMGVRGAIRVPGTAQSCGHLMIELEERIEAAKREFATLAAERITDEKKRAEMIAILMQWRLQGRRVRDAAATRERFKGKAAGEEGGIEKALS